MNAFYRVIAGYSAARWSCYRTQDQFPQPSDDQAVSAPSEARGRPTQETGSVHGSLMVSFFSLAGFFTSVTEWWVAFHWLTCLREPLIFHGPLSGEFISLTSLPLYVGHRVFTGHWVASFISQTTFTGLYSQTSRTISELLICCDRSGLVMGWALGITAG